ncbi:MAG: hypothetical protein ACK5Y8_20960 [Betaproteobacteria bacterium]|jgi:hypothetical protein|nr:hypothetical protein [Rubrivivax sp.]
MNTNTNTDLDWSKLSPLAMWRDWLVKSEAQWSESLSQLLKDPKASSVVKRQVDEMRMAHRQLSEVAQASLAAANLPSRSDLEALDERLGRVEDGLAQVCAQLSLLRESLVAQGTAATPARPRRDRKPPAASRA